MELRDTDRALVQAATAVAKLRCRSQNHTVAAAARTADGRVFTGVNVHHVTGGTCAELIVVGTAATQGVTGLETIVTVADRGREIVAPCDRCRQVLRDHFPALRVIIGSVEALRLLPIGELPPEHHVEDGQQNTTSPASAPAPPAARSAAAG